MSKSNFVSLFYGLTLYCLGSATSASAANFTQIDLMLEAYVNPAADVLDFSLYLTEKEVEATVEVRAFTVSGKDSDIITPIKARGEKKNASGEYYNTYRVQRPAEITPKPLKPVIVPGVFIFAYKDMELPIGDHKIGFELKALVEGKEVTAGKTPLSLVTITKEPRTKMTFIVERELAEGQELWMGEKVAVSGSKRIGRTASETPLLEPVQGGWYRKRLEGWSDAGIGRIKEFVVRADKKEEKPSDKPVTPPEPLVWEPSSRGMTLFASNRNQLSKWDTSPKRFGSKPAEVIGGISFFDIPMNVHKMGTLERPESNLIGRTEAIDPNKHFKLRELFVLPNDKFFDEEIRKKNSGFGSDDILLSVHGFNNGVERASLSFMQLVYDIRFQGVPIAFLWPSLGESGASAYHKDEETAEITYQSLADFLVELTEVYQSKDKPGKIHLLAHSMGNRVLLNAVHLAKKKIKANKPFGEIVLAAPDIDVTEFVTVIPSAIALSNRVTLYHCEDDKALKASRVLHVNKRVGEAAVPFEGVVNIDAKNANTSILGHDYYVSKSPLLYDLDILINKHTDPAERPTLRKGDIKGHTVWYFP